MAPSPAFSGIWAQQCDQALANASLSSFQRKILSTHWVTDAQYQEAQNGFVMCMADRGWVVVLANGGGGTTTSAAGAHQGLTDAQSMEVYHQDRATCDEEFTSWVAPLYEQSKNNPQGLTFGQQLRACYEARGVPDGAGLSDDAFQAMATDPNYHASSPEGVLCWWDPTGSEGMTVQQAMLADAQRVRETGPESSSVQTAP